MNGVFEKPRQKFLKLLAGRIYSVYYSCKLIYPSKQEIDGYIHIISKLV